MRSNITSISFMFSLLLLVACDDGSSKTIPPVCGNGVVETGEACDGSDFAGMTCTSFGQPTGDLACTAQCTMDLTGCREINVCGDGILDAEEACEDDDFGTMTCASFGFDEGTLTCSDACTIDTSTCGSVEAECGDGIVQPANGESCDGDELGGNTCLTQGFSGGDLACLADCEFDTSDCDGYFTLTGRVWGPGADNANMRAENWFPVAGARVIAYLTEPPAPSPLPTGLCIACEDPPAGLAAATTAADGTFELQLAPNQSFWLVVEKGVFRRVSQIIAGNVGEFESLEPAIGNPRNPITTLPNRNIPASRQWIPKILVVQGSFEQLDQLFGAQGFNYGVEIVVVADTAAASIFNDLDQLRQYHMIITTDGDDSTFLTQSTVRSNLQQYVSEGGKLFVDDFSYDYAEQPFPEFLSFFAEGSICGAGITAPTTIGDCTNWSSYSPTGTPGDLMLGAWLTGIQGGGAFQLLGLWSIIAELSAGLQGNCDDVNDPYCVDGTYMAPPKVWMYGDWSTYTQQPLTVSWNYYCGRVLYTVFHTHSSGTATGYDYLLILQEKIMMYLIMEMQTCSNPSLF